MPKIEELTPAPCRTRPIIFVIDGAVDGLHWEQQLSKTQEIFKAYQEKADKSADYRVKALVISYSTQSGFAKATLLEESEIAKEGLENLLHDAPPNYDSVLEKLHELERDKTLADNPNGSLPPYVYWFFSGKVPFNQSAQINEQLLTKILTRTIFEYACFWFIALSDNYDTTHDLFPIYNIIKLIKGVYPISADTDLMVLNGFALEVVNQWSMTDLLPVVCNEICFYFLVDTSGGVKGVTLGALNSAFETIIASLKHLAQDRGLHISIGVIEYSSGCRCLTPNGAIPIDEFQWEPFQGGGLVDFGQALIELKKMLRHINLRYPSPCYMPVFTFFSCRYATDNWEKAYKDLELDFCFAAGEKIGIAMNEKSKSFLHEFLTNWDIHSLDGTSFEHFGENAQMVPMDDVIPEFYIRVFTD